MAIQLPRSLGIVGQRAITTLVNTVVVYNRKDGRIVHRHQFVTAGSSALRTHENMEQKALEFFTPPAGGSNPDLAVLHLHQQALKPNTTYRVDLSTSRLVEVSRRADPNIHPKSQSRR
jgi:hypothetical protein